MNCLQHLGSSRQGTTVCKLCAAHQVLTIYSMSQPHVVQKDSSAVGFDRVEMASVTLYLINLLKSLTDEDGEETGVYGKKTLMTSFRKCHIPKPEHSSPNQD